MAKKGKRHEPHEEHADETWLIPYADLLTLLLALFIVLFASSSVDAKKFESMMVSFHSVLSGGAGIFEPATVVPIDFNSGGKGEHETDALYFNTSKNKQTELNEELAQQLQQETAQLENLKEKIDQYIEENGLSSQLTTELNAFQLVLRISDNALFASGSATVKPESRALAVAISDMLVEYPQYEVVVAGHTDNQPIRTAEFADNWELSLKRAYNFLDILISNRNIDPARFSPVGYGEYRPVETNDTAAGRAANRRVEVSIIRNIVDPNQESITLN